MDIKNFLFSFEKLCKYVYSIFYIFNIYGDLYSFMFIYVIIYEIYLFSKYLRFFWVLGIRDIKQNKISLYIKGILFYGEVKYKNNR